MSNYVLYKTVDEIIYPCPNLSKSSLVKWFPGLRVISVGELSIWEILASESVSAGAKFPVFISGVGDKELK